MTNINKEIILNTIKGKEIDLISTHNKLSIPIINRSVILAILQGVIARHEAISL